MAKMSAHKKHFPTSVAKLDHTLQSDVRSAEFSPLHFRCETQLDSLLPVTHDDPPAIDEEVFRIFQAASLVFVL